MKSFDGLKATQSNDIPTKIIKEDYDILATFMTENFNIIIEDSAFPVLLKQTYIKPIYKKKFQE